MDIQQYAHKLERDVLWLENQVKRLRDAKALSGDKLRALADETLAAAKKRRQRTSELAPKPISE